MDEAKIHERRWWALAVLCVSLLVITLDNPILNVAIPDLIRGLGATTAADRSASPQHSAGQFLFHRMDDGQRNILCRQRR